MLGYFVRHPNAANLIMVGLILLGVSTLPQMKRETFPELVRDEVRITIAYPGAAATDIEDAICRRVEDALDGIANLKEVRCEAKESVAVATAVMVENAQMARVLDDVKTEIDAIDDFPADVETPVIVELGRTDDVIAVAVTGIDDPVALKAYAEALKFRMQRDPQIEQVTISGFSDHQIRIGIPEHQLQRFGLSVADVAATLRRQSVGLPAGRLEGDAEDVLLRFDDQRKAIEAFRDVVILSSENGAELHLGEVAVIDERFDRPEERVDFNGRRAALLTVKKNRSQDALVAVEAVTRFVEDERSRVPAGIKLALTRDMSSIVRDRLELLIRNSAQGLLLVFLVLWLFFGLRYSFWVAMGLPVAFLGGLFVIAHMGISINMISMVGLLIAVGLLMDDAIVIAENIARHLREGDDPLHSATAGAREVLPGIVSSFLTTVLVFGSVAFISGTIGQILRVLPQVLIVVLTVSLVEAFLILPNHLYHAYSRSGPPDASGLRGRFERRFEAFRDGPFRRLLERAIRYRYFTIGVIVMMFLASIATVAGGAIGFRGFPDIDGDTVEARVLLPQGTPLSRTAAVVEQITQALAAVNERFRPAQPGGQPLVTNVAVLYGENPDAYESGPHVARISADLLGAEIRSTRVDTVLNTWREAVGELPDVITVKYAEAALGPAGRAIDLRLHGTDLERLKLASEKLQAWLNGFAGVLDVGDDLRPGKREYRIRLAPGAGSIGFDARQLADQLRAAYQGVTVDEFPVGAETYEVELRLVENDRRGIEDLRDMKVNAPDGALVPLSAVATIEEYRGWARIFRVDGLRTVAVQGDVDSKVINAQALVGRATTAFLPALREAFPDIEFSVEGESKESGDTSRSMLRNMALGLAGVYLLLAFQFRGYLLPIAVMSVIPTALIGVIAGHALQGIELSMPSMMGAASLAGIVVNNSILLVQFIEKARAAGLAPREAALASGIARFRPIFITSVTTIAGLTPLLLEKSPQAQILIPLATSLAFGLAAATIIAMFLVPAIYCVLHDFGWVRDALETDRTSPATEAPPPPEPGAKPAAV